MIATLETGYLFDSSHLVKMQQKLSSEKQQSQVKEQIVLTLFSF
jgi:hypothetical protein